MPLSGTVATVRVPDISGASASVSSARLLLGSATITDTFTRTVAPGGWGTSDSGIAWSAVAGSTPSLWSVNGTQGVVSGTGSPVAPGGQYLDTSATTNEATFDIYLDPASAATANSYINFGTGFSPEAWVGWDHSTNKLRVFRNDSSFGTLNTSGVISNLFGTWWTMRARADASGAYAKIWARGTTEPAAWTVTAVPTLTPTTITQTGVNFQCGTVTGTNGFTLDNLSILVGVILPNATTTTLPINVVDWNDLTGVTADANGLVTFGTGGSGRYHVSAYAGLANPSVPLVVSLVPMTSDSLDTVSEIDTRASSGNSNLLQTGNPTGHHQFATGDTLKVTATQYSGSTQTVSAGSLSLVRLEGASPSGSSTCSLAIGTPYTATNIWQEATTATGSIVTGTAGITFAWLIDTNGNTPAATNMTTFGGYWTQVANMPTCSRSTWNLAFTNQTGYLTATATYTPGYANDGAGAALMINLRSKARSVVQSVQAATTTGATFANPVTTGNIILMFCLAEPFPWGSIAPVGSGWTLLASENNYMWNLGSTAGDAIYNVYARCANVADGQSYSFNKSSGYSTGCGIVLVEITP